MADIYYFHGGAPGLLEGGVILPPPVTGARSTTLESQVASGANKIAQRPDKVYLTTDVELARVYAELWTADETDVPGGGSVYQVVVEDGSMEPDQDLLSSEGLAFQSNSAVIQRIHDKKVVPNPKKISKKLSKVMRQHEKANAARTLSLEEANKHDEAPHL
ncbi:hypothetical protein LJR078_001032 [Arthrobacter sp. LjRoot78]|uniref:hypothetical protein n=1 Tax=Arthrobacter sp. LjRoot78 TaxID=3342338 RepID=UPI003ECC7CB7